MSISINTHCLQCFLNRNLEKARSLGDEATAFAFSKELLAHVLAAPEGVSSPWLNPGAVALLKKYYGVDTDDYEEEKRLSNTFVLERMDAIRSRIENAEDPLLAGLQFSILGNYLDFAALGRSVRFETLEDMLREAQDMQLDMDCYERLRRDLATGRKLLYLTDNCGEIVFDRLFAEQIAAQYPQLQITFCVRGGPTHNDATREDAITVGIPFPVIDNGNTVGGTELSLLSSEAKRALEEADVVIAKGMGNTETMHGCGYNVYYAFLVKCSRFVQEFGKPLMTPMLVSERNHAHRKG